MVKATEKSPVSTRRRKGVLVWYILFVLIWSAGGMLVWTGTLKPLFSHIGSKWGIVIFGPFGFLTWPAHEASLCFSGKGLGSNALSSVSISSFASFVVWSCILWMPLFLLHRRSTPLWFGVMAQILLILLTLGLFWFYGRG